jgi:hypothetical protein
LNQPIVHGLQAEFGDRVDFIHADVDDQATRGALDRYAITGRTQYVLVDAEGNIIQKWFGRLSPQAVADFIEDALNGT